MSQKPDFIITGFNRCGTSTLHQLIGMHPDIFMSEPKEIHFFNRNVNYRAGLDWYLKHFEGADSDQLCGEATAPYLYHGIVFDDELESYKFQPQDDAIVRMAKYNPGLKLIVSMRDPIMNAKSVMEHARVRGVDDPDITLEQAIEAEVQGRRTPENSYLCYLYRSRYSLHIQHLFKHFPKEQVLFLKFEDWTKDQQGAVDQITAFLGVDDFTLESDDGLHANAGISFKDNFIKTLMNSFKGVRKLMPILRKIGLKDGYEALSPESYKRLQARYQEEYRLLPELTGIDTTCWSQ